MKLRTLLSISAAILLTNLPVAAFAAPAGGSVSAKKTSPLPGILFLIILAIILIMGVRLWRKRNSGEGLNSLKNILGSKKSKGLPRSKGSLEIEQEMQAPLVSKKAKRNQFQSFQAASGAAIEEDLLVSPNGALVNNFPSQAAEASDPWGNAYQEEKHYSKTAIMARDKNGNVLLVNANNRLDLILSNCDASTESDLFLQSAEILARITTWPLPVDKVKCELLGEVGPVAIVRINIPLVKPPAAESAKAQWYSLEYISSSAINAPWLKYLN